MEWSGRRIAGALEGNSSSIQALLRFFLQRGAYGKNVILDATCFEIISTNNAPFFIPTRKFDQFFSFNYFFILFY